MPAQQGLRFEDLLKAQERLAAQGDKSAAANLQRLQEMEKTLKADHEISKQDKLLQVVQTYQAVQADKDDDRIVVATEKTADTVSEVNDNIIKLADAIKQNTGGQIVDQPEIQGTPTSAIAVEAATKEVEKKKSFLSTAGESVRKLGRLETYFDVSGPSRGMLDDVIRARIEKSRLEREASTSNTPSVPTTRNVKSDTLKSIVSATGAAPQIFQAPLTASREATTNLLGGAEEQQMEQNRLWQQEIDTLNRIEENTRSLRDTQKPKQESEATPKSSAAAPAIGRVPGAGMLGRTLQAAASFLFSAAGLKLLVGAGLFLSLKQLSEDYQEGKARSEEYQDLRTEREAGTITPEGQAKLDELERKKQSGEATVFSGSQSEEVGRTLKSKVDKETAEDILKGLDSDNEEDRTRAQTTLKEFGVSKQVLQRYYDRVYGPEANAQTRKGATLGSVSVEMGELQRTIPAQQEIARGDAAAAAKAGTTSPPTKPFVIGQGDASDLITGENGQKIEYKYSSGQPYTWTAEEIKEKVKILQQGGQVDFGTDFIPKDEQHRNPILKNKEISAATPTPASEAPATPEVAAVPPALSPVEMARLSPVERSRIRREQNLQAQRAARAQKATPTLAAPTPVSPVLGEVVYDQSEANAAAATVPTAAPSAPVVINAPTNVQQTSNYGAKSPPRNTESSYQQYNRSKY